MHKLDVAILKTVIYGDIFNFPMTAQEIHHFLIHNEPVPYDTVKQHLDTSISLKRRLCHNHNYYALNHREHLLSLRIEREKLMASLSKQMTYYGRLLSYFPFVEFVGITGALAMRNPASATDDLDYIVITRPGRVWLARAFIIVLVRIMHLRDIEICPNYVLASDQLLQSRQDLYIAHELAQVIPLSNDSLYQRLRDENLWTNQYLPNASYPFHRVEKSMFNRLGLFLKRALEGIFSSPLGKWLEQWEYRRKARRFGQQATAPTAAAQIDQGHVKGHFNDYGHHVMTRYQNRLDDLKFTEPQADELRCVGG